MSWRQGAGEEPVSPPLDFVLERRFVATDGGSGRESPRMAFTQRFVWLAPLVWSGCFSPNVPVDGEAGEGSTTESSGAQPTTSTGDSPADVSTSGDPTSGAEDSTGMPSDDTTSSESGESGGSETTTGAPACDVLDDTCPDGTLCDGHECVEPPDGMVAVGGGAFMMGCNEALDIECADDEYPYHEVTLSSFAIDQTEVTADAFDECVDAGACDPPTTETAFEAIDCFPTSGDLPVVCVDWHQARDYCEWRDSRLPTEAEWEKAARGGDGRVFPWGNEAPTCTYAHFYSCVADEGPIAVGSKPAGASPYGALDMVGNVFEWVGDWYAPAYYVSSPDVDPPGPAAGDRHGLRSSSFFWYDIYSRASLRAPNYDTPTDDDANTSVGFRCAATP